MSPEPNSVSFRFFQNIALVTGITKQLCDFKGRCLFGCAYIFMKCKGSTEY